MKKFTLIELLVVVAIIGVLFTMLLPSLKKARQKSLSAVCLSNLKQQGISAISYSSENKEIFVAGTDIWWNQIFWNCSASAGIGQLPVFC